MNLLLNFFLKCLLCLDSGCDSVTDAEVENDRDLQDSGNIAMNWQHKTSVTRPGSLTAVQPDRIRCGVQYVSYQVVMRCQNGGKKDAVLVYTWMEA